MQHSRPCVHTAQLHSAQLLRRFAGIRTGGVPVHHYCRVLLTTTDGVHAEVMSSQPYDFKSDMWSLGCCLYEMTSLKHAFDASDMSSLVCKIMRGEHLPIPQHVSAWPLAGFSAF